MTSHDWALALPWLIVVFGCWLGFQLVQQNGRILLRLESLEERLAQLSETLNQRLEQMSQAIDQQTAQLGNAVNNAMLAQAGQPVMAEAAPRPPEGLPIGTPAPDFELSDLSGARHTLAEFRGRKVLLIFFSPQCGYCTMMAEELAALSGDGSDGRPVPVLISSGSAKDNRQMVKEYGLKPLLLLQKQMEVATKYEAMGTPTGYLVDEQGVIASDFAIGAPPLIALLAGEDSDDEETVSAQNGHAANGSAANGHKGKGSLENSRIARDGLAAGTPAPDFRLPRVDGGELSLQEYRGKKVVLVFSDPECGPCTDLAPQLEILYRSTPHLHVLMISRGDVEQNLQKIAEHDLTFPVLLQKKWEISKQYAMFATPIGYLLDEHGIIATDVAVGTEPILSLFSAPAAGVATNGVATNGVESNGVATAAEAATPAQGNKGVMPE